MDVFAIPPGQRAIASTSPSKPSLLLLLAQAGKWIVQVGAATAAARVFAL